MEGILLTRDLKFSYSKLSGILLIGVLLVKRYLSTFFLILSAIILIVGLRINLQWSGIAAWGLSFISLIFAAYYTKYIPNDEKDEKRS